MFASRNRNENTIYEHQQAAGAKQLNQNQPGLAPKTPAPKTPFRSQKHNENVDQPFGRTEGKAGKQQTTALVTPANPRARAPLGDKTTNAKAAKTPFGGAQNNVLPKSAKPTSPRLRRSKIKVHETAPAEVSQAPLQPDEPDIEYMPPRGTPLEDLPQDVWPSGRTYPKLEPGDIPRGLLSLYAKDDNDSDSELSDFDEKVRNAELQNRREQTASIKKTTQLVKPTTKPTGSTLRAKDAAHLLSSRATSTMPRFAAPTATTMARAPSRPNSSSASKVSSFRPVSNTKFAIAKAASNSTIGYSKGRAVSASTHPTLSSIFAGNDSAAPHRASPKPHIKDFLAFQPVKNDASYAERDDDDDLVSEDGLEPMIEGLDDFQLDPVEEL